MAEYCLFWKGLTPEAFWDLDIEDYYALGRRMQRWNEEHDRKG